MKKKIKKNAKDIFREYINNLPVRDYKIKRNKIIEECYIDYFVFNRWSKGIQNIPIIYFEKINQIAGFELLKYENEN